MRFIWPYPKVFAHRGGGALAPENTLAALRCGLARGFHAVEFDVMLTHDEVPILMHDPVLGRTVAGSGDIPALTMEQLSSMDAGGWFGEAFKGEKIPTYEQAFTFCRSHSIWMNVEIKPAPGFEMQTGAVVGAATRRLLEAEPSAHVDVGKLPLLSSFSFDALLAVKQAAPDLPRGYLVDVIPNDWHGLLDRLGAVALHTNHKNLTRAQAQAVKDAGFGLFCYTVNDTARATEILSWGVDAFCTDRIDLIGADFV